VLEEGRQVARKADAILERGHLTVDAGDFLQAQGVDLVGSDVEGGLRLQHGAVVGVPVRQLPDAGLVGGGRLGLAQVGDQVLEAGLETFAQGGLGASYPFALVGEVGLCDLALEVGQHGAVRPLAERRAGDQRLAVADDQWVGEARRLDALGLLAAQADDDLLQVGLHTTQALDIGGGVDGVGDRVVVDQGLRDAPLRPAHLADRIAVVAPPEHVEALAAVGLEEAVAEPGLGLQGVEPEALQPFEIAAGELGFLQPARLGDLVPFALAHLQAEARLHPRRAGDAALVDLLEEGV
jgi:hypothetical protein